MADGMMRITGFAAFALSVALLSFAVNAEHLTDPTRPPDQLGVPSVPTNGTAGLQSIIISKHRRAAIIGGETVELGGKYGDAKLIEVNEGSVVLRGTQGRQVMTMFPDVKMTAAKRAGNEKRPDKK